MITVPQLARAYGVTNIVEWRDTGTGVGIHNGAGSLIPLMDCRPDLRWAVGLEKVVRPVPYGLTAFMEAVDYLGVPVAAYLCFLLDEPEAAVEVLAPVAGRLEYHANFPMPGRSLPLDQLLRYDPV